MSRVIMMCGPAGAGKSTIARRLQAAGAVRLSLDEEAWERGARQMPLPAALHEEIEADLKDRLLRCVAAGEDVVLDFSFWSRRARDAYRELLRPHGVQPETLYLATPRHVALERLRARRGEHANDFVLTEDLAAEYFDHFEVPTAEEGPLTIIG